MKTTKRTMNRRDASQRELLDVDSWVDRYADVLYRYALAHIGDRHVAEDLVQETFLAAWEKRDQFEGRSALATWLIGILRNKIGTHRRQSRREPPKCEVTDELDFARMFFDQRHHWKRNIAKLPLDPQQEVERRELLTVLAKCISELPTALAEAFSLREMDGWETDDICQCLGITRSNFLVRMHRARLLLRRCLELRWLKS